MKHTITLTFLLLVGSILLAQSDSLSLEDYIKNQKLDVHEISKGMLVEMQELGTGEKPKQGDYVMLAFKGMRLNGKVFDASPEDEPFVFQLGYRQVIQGWDVGLASLPAGSKFKLFLAPQWAYGQAGVGKQIPPNSSVIFEMDFLKIMDEAAYEEYMVALEQKQREDYLRKIEEQFKEDKIAIHEYSQSHNLRLKRISNGVSYGITKEGKGDYPKSGDIITLHYEGRLTDDSIFDSSFDKAPFVFPLGYDKAIQGLESAIPNFRKGSEGWVLIPSKLAYGPMSIEEDGLYIPANSILIFKIKIIDIQEGQ